MTPRSPIDPGAIREADVLAGLRRYPVTVAPARQSKRNER